MKRLAIVDDASESVIGEWSGGDEQQLPARAGVTYVAIPDDVESRVGLRWRGGTRFDPFPETTRLVPVERFFDLFRYAQREAIFDLDATDKQVRDYLRRVDTGSAIDLLHPRVALGLTFLNSKGVFGADAAVADTEIARIVAGTLPPGE